MSARVFRCSFSPRKGERGGDAAKTLAGPQGPACPHFASLQQDMEIESILNVWLQNSRQKGRGNLLGEGRQLVSGGGDGIIAIITIIPQSCARNRR